MKLRTKLRYSGIVLALCGFLFTLFACTDAETVSYNISQAADQFKITRRIVFYNGITNDYILELTGRCSIEVDTADNQLEVTCKQAENQFVKHYLGISDNVTYFAEQIETADVSVYHYTVRFKPQSIIPAIEIRADVGELVNAVPDVDVDL